MAYNLGNIFRMLVSLRLKEWVIKDNTIEAEKDRRKAYKTCPVLLSASCGDNNKRTNMAKHNEEHRPVMSRSRITEKEHGTIVSAKT